MMQSLSRGTPVFTADGDKIGDVKEQRQGVFKLDVTAQPDFWLRASDVMTADFHRVTMRFSKDDLGDYKVDDDAARSFPS
jgi:hypothetical protein